MAAAGIAWGVYSLGGRLAENPLAAVLLLVGRHPGLGVSGLLLAMLSGAVASAIGYVAWYATVCRMTASRAAIIQLAVPVLAALGGVAFLEEAVSPRLVIATITVLGRIGLAMASRAPPSRDRR
jgi:drug/metabolite transporter (DMT)-like permease